MSGPPEVTVSQGKKKVKIHRNECGMFLSTTFYGMNETKQAVDNQLLDMIEDCIKKYRILVVEADGESGGE